MSDVPFPPEMPDDIDNYDFEEIVAGYSEWREIDPQPGSNRSAGYRWGWMNGARDRAKEDDGFDHIRWVLARRLRQHQGSPP